MRTLLHRASLVAVIAAAACIATPQRAAAAPPTATRVTLDSTMQPITVPTALPSLAIAIATHTDSVLTRDAVAIDSLERALAVSHRALRKHGTAATTIAVRRHRPRSRRSAPATSALPFNLTDSTYATIHALHGRSPAGHRHAVRLARTRRFVHLARQRRHTLTS